MPIIKEYRTVNSRTERNGVAYIMTYISDKEELELDNNHAIKLKRGKDTFEIKAYRQNVICYGNIDFTTNSDDYITLRDLIPFNKVVHIPVDYDLATHCCYSPNKSYRTCECSDIAKVCQYNYGVLGKPNKVIIFKDY